MTFLVPMIESVRISQIDWALKLNNSSLSRSDKNAQFAFRKLFCKRPLCLFVYKNCYDCVSGRKSTPWSSRACNGGVFTHFRWPSSYKPSRQTSSKGSEVASTRCWDRACTLGCRSVESGPTFALSLLLSSRGQHLQVSHTRSTRQRSGEGSSQRGVVSK